MKRLFFALSFLAAVAGAFATNASRSLSAETAFIRNPDVAHCTSTSVSCDINLTNPCTISGKQGYREGCSTILFKQ